MDMEVDLGGIFLQNTTFNYDDYVFKEECEDGTHWLSIFLLVLYVLSLVLGLLGNGLVFWIMAQGKRGWTLTDTCILHLGVADCLLLLTLPFRAAQTFQSQEWSFRPLLCKVTGAIFNINIYCGLILLSAVIVDRYLCATHHSQTCSRRRSFVGHVTCACMWLLSTLLSVSSWVSLGVLPSQEKSKCGPASPSDSWHLASRLIYHVVSFLLPCTVLLFYFGRVLLQRQQSGAQSGAQSGSQSGSQSLQKREGSRLFLTLALVFFVCLTPYNIALVVDTFGNKPAEPLEGGCERARVESVVEVTAAVCCFRACLNPFLYFLVCGNFRKVVLRKLRRQRGTSNDTFLWDSSVTEKTSPEENGALNQNGFQQEQSNHC